MILPTIYAVVPTSVGVYCYTSPHPGQSGRFISNADLVTRTGQTDLLSIAAFAADQLLLVHNLHNLSMDVEYFRFSANGVLVELHNVESARPTNSPRTAAIMAEVRAIDAEHAARNAVRIADGAMPGLSRIIPPLATSNGRREALATSQLILEGTADWDRNNAKRDHSLPRRALSMASSRGRATPDMLDSLMAFFRSPADMAEGMLASFLPTKVGKADAEALLADEWVADMVGAFLATHGKGALPTPAEAIKLVRNPATGHKGRAPGRLLIADGVTPPTVDPKRRGRPSGPKYVAHLTFGQAPVQGCENIKGLAGGNDVAHGAGFDQGAGWVALQAMPGRMSPAQRDRRDVAYAAIHAAEAKAYEARLAAEADAS